MCIYTPLLKLLISHQLLKERDLERAEVTRAASQTEEAERKLADFKQEFLQVNNTHTSPFGVNTLIIVAQQWPNCNPGWPVRLSFLLHDRISRKRDSTAVSALHSSQPVEMSTIFEQVKLLFDQELYSNVVSLVNMVSTATEHNPQMMSMADKLQMLIYYGDSLFHLGQYRLADSVYRHAIQFRKSIIKSKSTTKINENNRDIVSDVDIKYQMHLCAVKLNQLDEAIRILQSIFAKQRTPKINMALAKRFQMLGMERPAITAYKEVLRECPMALEAAEALLALGVSAAEGESLVLDSSVTGMDWMTSWIKAHAHTQNKDYTQAINTFKQLEERSQIRGNHSLLASLGEAYYYSGDNKNALVTLKRAHALDKNQQRGLDILAALLASEKQISEIEKLVPVSWTNEEHGPQAWIALSYLLYANNNLTRAAYLAQKVSFFDYFTVT
ncbi:hypothetical protein LSTR_LSTR014457 [Laodelphax striatellus]|uniref:Anaphase-promoting complex subunit 7 n=1 Tax=Laodelphax striatellus TaxID=195883 RepID=A0A482XZM0_LAOST|nr:hypothetical protein LSTR_LSTR014457 [Laodelphax striatellus]